MGARGATGAAVPYPSLPSPARVGGIGNLAPSAPVAPTGRPSDHEGWGTTPDESSPEDRRLGLWPSLHVSNFRPKAFFRSSGELYGRS